MTFRDFDAKANGNEFWKFPMEKVNIRLEKNHQKDALKRKGVSLVMGCPFSESVQTSIIALRDRFQKESGATVTWRTKPAAWHFSLYGLVLPEDYTDGSWPLSDATLKLIQQVVHDHPNIALEMQGIGILGMGAVSVRASDSAELEHLRDAIGQIPGVSKERFGSRSNKIVIGRVQPGLAEQDRVALRAACDACKDMSVGTIDSSSIRIVQYNNTFLEDVQEVINIH